jgi:hypothetical protein
MRLTFFYPALVVVVLSSACDSRKQNNSQVVASSQPSIDSPSTAQNLSSPPPLTLNPDGDKNASKNEVSAEQLNSLEKSLVLFKSTPEQFQSFKDDGGLEVNSSWNGYQVSSIEIEYKKDVLSFMHLFINSGATLATMNNLKKDLSKECGNEWKMSTDGNSYLSETQTRMCKIEKSYGKQGFHVFIMGGSEI